MLSIVLSTSFYNDTLSYVKEVLYNDILIYMSKKCLPNCVTEHINLQPQRADRGLKYVSMFGWITNSHESLQDTHLFERSVCPLKYPIAKEKVRSTVGYEPERKTNP
jgi:hypothetical protein